MIKSILKQIICVLLSIVVPILWKNLVILFDLDNNLFTLSLGSLLILESYIYSQLPLDLIPNFIPILGKCDNLIVSFLGLIGFWMILYVGYISTIHYL
jgi:hypothetical protein